MKKITPVLAVLFFMLPAISSAAALTQQQSSSLIAVVQSSPGTPASAFVSLITAFSNISITQATSLITVVQAAPGVPANAFVNLLTSFTVDTPTTQPAITATNQAITPTTTTQSTQNNLQTTQPVTPALTTTTSQPAAPSSTAVACDNAPQFAITVFRQNPNWYTTDSAGNITYTGQSRYEILGNPATITYDPTDIHSLFSLIRFGVKVTSACGGNFSMNFSGKNVSPQINVSSDNVDFDPSDLSNNQWTAYMNKSYGYISTGAPGNYTAMIVANDGKTTGTTTVDVMVQ